jgi:type II secretion system protein H
VNRRTTRSYSLLGQAGYTLVELLVVLVVIGIMLGLVSLSLRPDPAAKLNRDAERLEALFALAAEEAQLSSRPIAWRGDENGYAFFRQLPDGWAAIGDDPEFRARGWDLAPMHITLVASDVPRWSTRASGSGFNGVDDGTTALAFPRDGSQAAFELHLESDGKQVILRGDGDGHYRVEQGA